MIVHKMTYRQFAKIYPQYHIPYSDFLLDSRYVCRFTTDSIGQVVNLEVGFEDDDWQLK